MKRIDIDNICLDDVYKFLSDPKNINGYKYAKEGLAEYLNLLEKVRTMSMSTLHNEDTIINHLMEHESLSRYQANRIFEDSNVYFNYDKNIPKDAYRNIIASGLQKIIQFSILAMRDVKDAAMISKMYVDLAKVRGLDQPELPKLPEDKKQYVIVSYNPDDFENGMDRVNENKLKFFIENLDISEPEKLDFLQQSRIEKIKLPFIKDE